MRQYDRPFLRLALIGALVASLGLAACGRKGPLDLPPGGASLAAGQAAPADGEVRTSKPITGPDGKPLAPGVPNKRIPIDVLLN